MHEQHPGRAVDRTRAMAAAADIVGEKYLAAAAPVLLAVAGFDLEGAGREAGAGRPGANPDKGPRACP